MNTSRTPSPTAQKVERAFHRFDYSAGRVLQRFGALVCFGVAVWQILLAYEALDKFETVEHYLGTTVFISAFIALGIFLWTRNQRLSDAVHENGEVIRR